MILLLLLTLDVPHAAAPTIDGTIVAQEWQGATKVALTDGGQALLQHDGTFLYVALRGTRNGIGSLCATDGKRIKILHASAALGTAIFEDGKATQDFTWTNRDTGTSDAAMAERKKFLEAEGWFANTRRGGGTEREFQIRIDGRKEIPIALAYMSFAGDDRQIHYWPSELKDGCAALDLAIGVTDRTYEFDPKQWGVAVLSRSRQESRSTPPPRPAARR